MRKELLTIFCFLIYKAEPIEAFQKMVNAELFDVCCMMMGQNDDIDISTLQLVCGVVELG